MQDNMLVISTHLSNGNFGWCCKMGNHVATIQHSVWIMILDKPLCARSHSDYIYLQLKTC